MTLQKIILYLSLLIVLFSSAHASEIAFLKFVDNFWQVHVMNPEGKDIKQVSNSPYDKIKISWYPNGKHLLVNGSQNQIVKLNVDTMEEKNLKIPVDAIADAVVSPDGKKIAFSASAAGPVDRNDIFLIHEDGSNLKKITRMQGLQHEPVWSVNGEVLYFLSGIVGANKQHHDIYRYELATGAKTQITSASLFHFDIAVSKTNKLAYSNNSAGNYEIWQLVNNQQPVQLTDSNGIDSNPTWSPDEEKIMYESVNNGVANIWQLELSTKVTKQVTHAEIGARYPVWFTGAPQ